MALKLIVNHAWAECAEFKVTNGSDVETADTGVSNMVGGPRHLRFTQVGTAGLRFVYVNKNNKLAFDTFVMVNASRHLGHAFQLVSVASYPGALTTHINSSNWSPTLVNGGRDFVTGDYSVSNVEAVGVVLDSGSGGAYTKALNQLYFGRQLTVPNDIQMQIQPVWTAITKQPQRYLVDERRAISTRGWTQDEIDDLRALIPFFDEPVFLWDEAGGMFAENLYHCVVSSVAISQMANDLYEISFEVFRLRRYE